MSDRELNVVTGAFGYTGKYITRRLLEMDKRVITITQRSDRDSPFGDQVTAYPFRFNNPDALGELLSQATTVYNTYWVRFPRGEVTYEKAVENAKVLITTARRAGVKRFVHISITNPATDSPFAYFRGKAETEAALMESGLSYAILRPSLLFGDDCILINNIAWLLRRFPIFAIPGSGDYRLQPTCVEDLAQMAVEAGAVNENQVFDVVGPEVFTFQELVRMIAECIGSRSKLLRLPPTVTLGLTRILNLLVGDVVLTREEVQGLMAGLLVSKNAPTGTTRLSEWLKQHSDAIGVRYASELERHYQPR